MFFLTFHQQFQIMTPTQVSQYDCKLFTSEKYLFCFLRHETPLLKEKQNNNCVLPVLEKLNARNMLILPRDKNYTKKHFFTMGYLLHKKMLF